MNKTFKLYQIHINKQEHDKINAEGHDSVPKHKASLDMKIGLKTIYMDGPLCGLSSPE